MIAGRWAAEPSRAATYFDDLAEPLVAFDLQRVIIDATEPAERFYSYEHGELIGKSVDVLIPARLRQQDAPAPVARPEITTVEPTSRGAVAVPKRVLVVDDIDGADMLSEALARLGYETAIAQDGARAVEVAAAFTPDVVLVDIGLPVFCATSSRASRSSRSPGMGRRRIASGLSKLDSSSI